MERERCTYVYTLTKWYVRANVYDDVRKIERRHYRSLPYADSFALR